MASSGTEHLRLEHVRLAPEASSDWNDPGRECVIVILAGECQVEIGQATHSLKRANVFTEKASAVYVPAATAFTLTTESSAEVAVCFGDASPHGGVRVITSAEVECRTVGQGTYQRRVCDIVGLPVPSQHMVLGETFNEPGKWSSFPPHKHDEDRLPEEAQMEEIYLFKVDPPEGFGLQRLYSPKDGYDGAVVLRNDTIVPIPGGYHPVSAAPGCSLYYLWILWGRKRDLAPFEDPDFASVKARLEAAE